MGRYPSAPPDPQRLLELILAGLIRQLEARARERPVLAIFEDAHWADSTSLELLDRMIERVAGLPVLLVITFRPEFAVRLPYPWSRGDAVDHSCYIAACEPVQRQR